MSQNFVTSPSMVVMVIVSVVMIALIIFVIKKVFDKYGVKMTPLLVLKFIIVVIASLAIGFATALNAATSSDDDD